MAMLPTTRRRLGLVHRMKSVRRPFVLVVVVGLITLVLWSPAASAASGSLHIAITVSGQPAASSSDAHPAELYPNHPTQVGVTVINTGTSTVNVSTVRFEGRVLSLPLFSYDSAVNLSVAPHAAQSLTFPINMNGIGGLATGLIIATVTLIGPDGYSVASQTVVTKVHGSLISIYGLFALAVLALTISSLVLALIMLVRHRLPQNRWLRAIRFFVPGFGIGLVLTFTMAASGLFAPDPGHWLALLVVPSAAGLAAGFLTPAPDEEEFDDYDEDVLLAQIVMVDDDPLESEVVARATGDLVRATGPLPGIPDGGRATVAP